MTERPILFNGEMVRAILDGRKTQTRRIIKLESDELIRETVLRRSYSGGDDSKAKLGIITRYEWSDSIYLQNRYIPSPFGQIGDRLWVRETFTLTQHDKPVYRADARDADGHRWSSIQKGDPDNEVLWKPSIHMPRWASRINLEITNVRVERLQDISEADALAEGIAYDLLPDNPQDSEQAKTWFKGVWASIYGHAAWEANPWVWAYEFRRG